MTSIDHAKLILSVATLLTVLSVTTLAQDGQVVDPGNAARATSRSKPTPPKRSTVVPNQPYAAMTIDTDPGQTLIENLRTAGNFTKLLLVLDQAGLTATLAATSKTVTLFAPDDNAFALLPAVLTAKVTTDSAKARQFILPYIVSGRVTSKDLIPPVPRQRLITLAGSSLKISRSGNPAASPQLGGLLVIFDPPAPISPARGDAHEWPCCGQIVSADHVASNGVFHVVSWTGPIIRK